MPRMLFIALGLLSLIWGGSFFFIKLLLEGFGPFTISFLRSAFGLVTIIVIMLVLKKPFGFHKMRWVPLTIMALVNTAIPWSIIAFSETRLTSSMASVLNATTPIWTMLIGILFFRSVTNRLQWIGLAISTIGILILLEVNPHSIVSVDPIGFGCMIVATLCYGIGTQMSKRLSADLSMYQITFVTLLSAMVGSGVLAFAIEPVQLANLASLQSLGAVVGLGVFGSGVAYILFYYMVQKGSAEFASMVTYLVPVSAIIWGFTLLNEQIRWSLLVGLVFILSGVFLASRKRKAKIKGIEIVAKIAQTKD